jgi:hypothetical protein
MEPNDINIPVTSHRDLRLIDGESRQLRSNYYVQLVKYTRTLIRCLNRANICVDTELYYLQQLHKTQIEMTRVRSMFKAYTFPGNDDGPKAS